MQSILLYSLVSFAILTGGNVKKSDKSLENQKGWISLFDGKTTKGWHSYGKPTAGEAWKVEDGTIHLDAGKGLSAGDLVTNESFDNFDLKLDWKQAACMGDDWPDLQMIIKAAFSCAPQNGHHEVLSRVDYVTLKKGGEGALREFCDLLLKAKGRYIDLLNDALNEN